MKTRLIQMGGLRSGFDFIMMFFKWKFIVDL